MHLARLLPFLTAVLLAAVPAHAAASARPNIVLMMADDQGWGETGYNGHPHVQTPVLDEMSRTALRLDRFYAASPVCSPTRASVMTGRHANRSGAFAPNWSTRPEEITLAQILKQAGYRTGHFGKWHLGAVKQDSPLNPNRMGFDEYLSHDNFFEMDPPLSRNGAPPEIIKGESSEIVVAEAVNFTRKVQAEGKPFFVVIWFGSPHGPYSGKPEDVALYSKVPSEDMRRRFAEITAMDRAIGTYRQALRSLGVADTTLLWFNSDNGIPSRIPSTAAGAAPKGPSTRAACAYPRSSSGPRSSRRRARRPPRASLPTSCPPYSTFWDSNIPHRSDRSMVSACARSSRATR